MSLELILSSEVFALYSQVAVLDAEGASSYPQWDTGDEGAVFGPKGVAVATAGDIDIEVLIYSGRGNPGGSLLTQGEIEIGEQGLLVGNVVAASITPLQWAAGTASVEVYVDQLPRPTRVMFVLDTV